MGAQDSENENGDLTQISLEIEKSMHNILMIIIYR